MRRPIRVLAPLSALAFAAGACTNAKVAEPKATAVAITVSAPSVVAGNANLIARAQVFDHGVPILGAPVTFTAGSATQSAVTSSADGFASATFSLTVAGATTVSAASNAISDSTTVTVTPADPSALTLEVGNGNQTVDADTGAISWSVTVTDAFANVTNAPAMISVDAPAATIQGTAIANLRTAGTYVVSATVAGFPAVVGSAGLIVTHGAATQVVANVGEGAVGAQQSVDIYCDEKDAWGNATGGTFTAGTDVTTNPATTVTLVSGNHFQASGFLATGTYTAMCSNGTASDAKSFQVVAQNPTNSVVASLSSTIVQAGGATGAGSTTLTCSEVDGFGNPVAATIDATLTDPNGSIFPQAGAGPYTINNLTLLGSWSVTCTDANDNALTDSKQFQVIDTTPPTASITFTGANRLGNTTQTTDKKYAPQTILSFHITAFDQLAVGSEAINVTGPVTVIGSSVHTETSNATSGSFDVQLRVINEAATFSPIVVTAAATDIAGNRTVSATQLTYTVDPAVAFNVAPGAQIRTVYEQAQTATSDPSPLALASTAGDLYLTESDGTNEGSLLRLSTTTSGQVSTVLSDFIPAQTDVPTSGLVSVPGGYGTAGATLFQTLAGNGGEVDEIVAGVPSAFSIAPITDNDLAYGTVGTNMGLFVAEANGLSGFQEIDYLDTTGASTPVWVDTANLLATTVSAVAVEGAGDVLVGSNGGNIVKVTAAGANASTFITVGLGIKDIVLGTGNRALVSANANFVSAYDLTTAAGTNVCSDFNAAGPMAVDGSGALYVADQNVYTPYLSVPVIRIYKVTGY